MSRPNGAPYADWRRVARLDPAEAQEIWVARLELAQDQFAHGAITRDCFAASLYALGFRGQELVAELRHRDELKLQANGAPSDGLDV